MFDQVLDFRQQAQTKKVIHIEVTEAVRTPGGMIVHVPIRKTRSLISLGLVSEAK